MIFSYFRSSPVGQTDRKQCNDGPCNLDRWAKIRQKMDVVIDGYTGCVWCSLKMSVSKYAKEREKKWGFQK